MVVTGATGQLGSTFANTISSLGATVYGLDKNVPSEETLKIKYLKADVASKKDVQTAFDEIVNKEGRIDVLINNAGVSTFEPFERRTSDSFDMVLDVNVKGLFNCIQSYVDVFDQNNMLKGCVLNIGSLYGTISPDFRIYGENDRKSSEVYGASKAAVIQLTKYFAVHLASRNIRVNCISPGGVFNPITPQSTLFQEKYCERVPLKRMANQEELIGAVLYMVTDAASYTTGQDLIIDGGMSCW